MPQDKKIKYPTNILKLKLSLNWTKILPKLNENKTLKYI